MGYLNLHTSLMQLLLNSIVTHAFDSLLQVLLEKKSIIWVLNFPAIALVTHFLLVSITSKQYIAKV